MARRFDVIVVGAGSSGGIVAARLTENPDRSVLLLEAGPDFPDEATSLPLFAVSGEHTFRVFGAPEFDWGIVDRDRAGRRAGAVVRLPRGKVVGGSSMLNSTVAVRPAPLDMDRWASLGCEGWDWNSLLPRFVRMERDLDLGHQEIHGSDGPIVIQRYKEASWAAVNRVFAEACDELGVPQTPDLNGVDGHHGVFGVMPHNRYKEVRQGTLVTYLREARARPNLTIRGSCLVDKILFNGSRAERVRFIGPEGPEEASAELFVVAAGVYNSPAILQRSGIGPAALLRSAGVKVVADLPVGKNLSDHVAIAFQFKAEGIAGMTLPPHRRELARPGRRGRRACMADAFLSDRRRGGCLRLVDLPLSSVFHGHRRDRRNRPTQAASG